MSKQEKLLILQMVADGQITPEQGVELLNALEPGKPRWEPSSTGGQHALEQGVEHVVERAEVVAESVASNIGRMLSGLFGGGFIGGPTFEFREEIKGQFPEEGELDLRLSSSNGRISVETWDQPGYLLTVIKKGRGRDEADARQMLENCYEFSQEGLCLTAKSTETAGIDLRGLSVGFALKIPASRKASVTLRSGNGRITLDGVTGSSCTASTGNGRVEVTRCGFDRAKLTTGNGRVEYEGSAGELKASSGNGAINVEMKGAGDWEFSTGNGRISIGVVRDGDTGYEMDLTARAGGITVEGLDDADVIEDVAISRSRWRYKARTPGFEQAVAKGRIKATTGNGKIRVWF